jgi:hypothetical protein
MSPDRSRRAFVVVCGVLSLLVPLGLEIAGVLPPSYHFDGATMTVYGHALHFPPVPTRLLLLSLNVVVILSSALLLARMRDQLTLKERELFVQTWQLRQLVPQDASVPTVAPAQGNRPRGCAVIDGPVTRS